MEEFKKRFILFLELEFNLCEGLKSDIEDAKDYSELGDVIRDHDDDIASVIGHECEEIECDSCNGECSDCKEKDDEYEELLGEFEEMEGKSYNPETYIEQEKLNILKTYHEDFSIEELQTFLSSRSTKIVI